jgi:hypothetical protein
MHNSKPTRTNKEAKTGQIIRIEQDQLHKHLDKVVRGTVEQTLNELLDAEADRLCQPHRDMSAARLAKTPAPAITPAIWRPRPARSNSRFLSCAHCPLKPRSSNATAAEKAQWKKR